MNVPFTLRHYVRHTLLLAALFFVLLCYYAYPQIPTLGNAKLLTRPGNATLGFEKIFYITLPQRVDRQDAMSLMAASSGLSLTIQHGVNGSSIAPKARPESRVFLRPEQLGCWRSHADTWKRILDENIETALILEDDGDWDINIRNISAQFSEELARQSLFPGLSPRAVPKEAPYGLDWDILYFGTCWDIPNVDDRPPYLNYRDDHAPNRTELAGSFVGELEGWGLQVTGDTRHRLLAPAWYPVCTLGYAITNRGAQKLLYNIGGYEGLDAPVDLAMISLIQKGLVRAYTVIPPFFTTFRIGGARDSDIDEAKYAGEHSADTHKGSENLKQSVREALTRLKEN